MQSNTEKIKVLVANPDSAGVGYFRLTNPHLMLQKNHGDKFHVTINNKVNWGNIDYLKNFNIIVFHRMMQHNNQNVTEQVITELRKHGVKTVIDIDDYYILPKEHPMYGLMHTTNLKDQVANNLKVTDYVTTTTPYFRDLIWERHNKNVHIFENGIDPTEKQFIPVDKNVTDRVRVGFIGGSSHLHDLNRMRKDNKTTLFRSLRLNHKDDMQLVLCGYDTRGTVTDPKTQQTRPIKPKESVWYNYELMFTDNYELVKGDKEYMKFLMRYVDLPYKGLDDKPYARRWTKGIKSYATHYNDIDVSLAPLVGTEFNKCKSQLKVIEAGFFKKALVAENIAPYRLDIKSGQNGFLVNSDKRGKMWYQNVKKLVQSPSLREDMGEALYETVKDKYDLRNITQKRAEFYESIV